MDQHFCIVSTDVNEEAEKCRNYDVLKYVKKILKNGRF